MRHSSDSKHPVVDAHEHEQLHGGSLRIAFFLTAAILVVEAGAGWLSHSLALLSDAGHILTDVIALGLAWFAVEQANRAPDARRSYGYHRVGILAAMLNGATLILIVGAILFEAVRRFQHPEPVQGGLVIVAALVAIGVNSFIALRLRGSGENLNVRAAMLHVIGDLAASIGVVIAGVIILLTGWLYADPLISVLIAALIAWGALRIVIETVNILLEGSPRGMNVDEVERLIEQTEGVSSAHDLHVWSLGSQQTALSVHIVVPVNQLAADSEHLVRTLEERLCGQFSIGHTTIQVEACHPCGAGALGHGVGEHNHPHTHGDQVHSHADGHGEHPHG